MPSRWTKFSTAVVCHVDGRGIVGRAISGMRILQLPGGACAIANFH